MFYTRCFHTTQTLNIDEDLGRADAVPVPPETRAKPSKGLAGKALKMFDVSTL